jgi:macrolide-specific efflux system membrane fusion protein
VPSVLLRVSEEVDTPAREAGVLAEIRVKEGQLVRAGEELARLDDRRAQMMCGKAELEHQAAQHAAAQDVDVRLARAAAVVAEAELRRAEGAATKLPESVSHSELDRLRHEVQRAALEREKAESARELAKLHEQIKRRELEIAQEHAERHRILAPLGGVVDKVHRHRGEWVAPGDRVLHILRLDPLRAEGFLPADALAQPLVGHPVTLVIDLPGRPKTEFRGSVTYISPEIDPVNRQVRVWAEIPNPQLELHPGLRGLLTVHARAEKGEP